MSRKKKYRGLIKDTLLFANFIREVAYRTDLTIPEADNLVRTVFDVIKTRLYQKYAVNIPAFGVFRLIYCKSKHHRTGSGARMWIKEHISPRFYFYKSAKDIFKRIDIRAYRD